MTHAHLTPAQSGFGALFQGEVLLGLLERREWSALFAEESCPFNQIDLLATLH